MLFENKDIKSWYTKEWEELRESMLKDECEQCGGKEILTIQHSWHPNSYGDIKYRITTKYGQLVAKENPVSKLVSDEEVKIYFNDNYKRELKECCSRCDSYNLMIRKTTTPKYRCNRCKNNFDVAISKLIPQLVDDRKRDVEKNTTTKIAISIIINKIYFGKINDIKREEYEETIEKEALVELLEQYIKYQSLERTFTFCKKCAFMLDVNDMNLCSKCRVNYKKVRYETCNSCKFDK